MLRLRPFAMHKALDTADACHHLADLGESAAVYAGGTELLIAMKLDMLRYDHLVDVKGIAELKKVRVEPDGVRIGAVVTHRELARHIDLPGALPLLAAVAGRIGNPRVRTAGTLGGSLCFGEPRSDLAIVMTALGGECNLVSAKGNRTLTVEELVATPYEADLQTGELLTAVRVGAFGANWCFDYRKIQWQERPLMGLAVGLREGQPGIIDDSRLALGGPNVAPQRFRQAEQLLRGPVPDVLERLPQAAGSVNDTAGWVDGDGYSALYKAHLLTVLLRRTVQAMRANRHGGMGAHS